MGAVDEASRPSVGGNRSTSPFCPECGQSLAFARPVPTADHPRAVSWRSIVLVVVGFYLAAVFGLDAWRATQTLQGLTGCVGADGGTSCAGLPRDLALMIASRSIGTGDAFRARTAELTLGRDARFAAVGLVGLAVGLGAALLRAQRLRLRRLSLSFGLNLGNAAEGLLVLFYGQVVAICAYHLVQDALAGTPLSWEHLVANADRALSSFFALAGIW